MASRLTRLCLCAMGAHAYVCMWYKILTLMMHILMTGERGVQHCNTQARECFFDWASCWLLFRVRQLACVRHD
jgi:hypothetical protein